MVAETVSPQVAGQEPYWKCIVAAAPQLLLALEFELVIRGYAPFGLTASDLTAAMAGEAIAVYAALVIGMLCLFLSGSSAWRTVRNFQVVAVMIGITAAAYAMGAAEAIQFLAMILFTCLGLLMSWRNPAATLQVVSRCVAAYAALAIAAVLCNTPQEINKWAADARVLQAGSVYFFIIAAVELSGLHLQYVPRNRVMIWTKLYGMVGKPYP